jgi:hypothetical protein
MAAPKWAFKYLVSAQQRNETFNDRHCAWMYARATNGTLWPIEAVADYERHGPVQIKDGRQPIAVD